jgi:hypothetical protein
MRKGKWKYISDGGSEMLFDLEKDISERHDLNYQRRDLVLEFRKLVAQWEAELARTSPSFVVK